MRPIVTYPNKHGEYRAVANVTSVANVTLTKGISSYGDYCTVGILKKSGNSLPFSEAADSPMLADMGREAVYINA